MGLLDGKVAVITGSGGGLGRAHALLLASEGAKFSPWTPDQFAAFVKAEMTRWAKVVKDAGLPVQ